MAMVFRRTMLLFQFRAFHEHMQLVNLMTLRSTSNMHPMRTVDSSSPIMALEHSPLVKVAKLLQMPMVLSPALYRKLHQAMTGW